MKFIDRDRELDSLDKFWHKKEAQFLVIYGKRRVGKTELIKQFMKNKPHLYFLAERINEHENLKTLGEIVGEYFDDEILARNGFDDWNWFFEYIRKHITKRIILIIDEFPYLAESNKAISSVFQAGWDERLKNTPIFLILCGSSISMMESETLAYKAPLYGRRTGQVFLKPFSFSEARQFYPALSFRQCLEFYSIIGGNPAYLQIFNPELSLEENIKVNILNPESLLYNEVEFILREELRQPRNYFAILKALALSKNKVSEMINETGLKKGNLHKYLFTLEDLHVIQKEIPVTEKHPLKSRKGLYKLQDQFFKFWFKYILPNRSKIEEGRTDFVLKQIRQDFNIIVSKNYELVAPEILRSYEEEIFPILKVGRWWYKNEEIDLIGLNDHTNEILFAEVKWSNKPIGTNIYEDLKRKTQEVKWGKENRKEYFALFSKSGFTHQMKKIAKEENILLFKEDKLIR